MIVNIKNIPIGYFKGLSKTCKQCTLYEIRQFMYATKIYDEAEVMTLTDNSALLLIKYETRKNCLNVIKIWTPRKQLNI